MSSILIHDRPTAMPRRSRHLHAVPATAPSAALSAPVRLTRRGKIAFMLVALIVLAVLAVALGSSTAATRDAGAALPTTTVTVKAGETLWQLAAEANPGGDIRATVDDIMRLNALPNASSLQMGSQVAVPVYE